MAAAMFFKGGKNIGYISHGVFANKEWDRGFAEKQQLAWEKTKEAIDAGSPCYGWEFGVAEFCVVYGYDDKGYYFSGLGADSGKGPKPWQELGDTGIRILAVYTVKRGKAADDRKTVKDALEFALKYDKVPRSTAGPFSTGPRFKRGLAAYDTWLQALQSGKAMGVGVAYNAVVWNECRRFGVAFLQEARDRLDADMADLFDEAIRHYEVVSQNMKELCETFRFDGVPYDERVKDEARCRTAIEALKAARDAEQAGLRALEKIVAEL